MKTIKIEFSSKVLQLLNDDIVIMIEGKDIKTGNETNTKSKSFFEFTQSIIKELSFNGNVRTSETYTSTLNSFKLFRCDMDVSIEQISGKMIEDYERFLKKRHLSMNSISFYMRILRAIYNRAVDAGMTEDTKPFKNVYTGIGKTVKRAISLSDIENIKSIQLAEHKMIFARDMFMFSFYTRGMSFVDMAYLKKENLKNGILTYRRKKTGQELKIKWKECMQDIVDRNPSFDGVHLLPIIDSDAGDERNQYKNKQYMLDKALKSLSQKAKLDHNLTMYVARHSWASIAKSMNIPTSIICDGMGHNSEKTTMIYLKSIDAEKIDEANDMILKCL
jgi:site-specific recombinase XerD